MTYKQFKHIFISNLIIGFGFRYNNLREEQLALIDVMHIISYAERSAGVLNLIHQVSDYGQQFGQARRIAAQRILNGFLNGSIKAF